MTPSQLEELNWDWEFWARPNQLIPKGDWLTWLLLAGRGFGKTRSAAEAVRALVCGATPLTAGKHARIALVAETAADARDVMVEGESGLLAVHPQEFRPLYEPSKRRLACPNGALAR
jgi:phage terminase large subunit-like protein